MFECFHCLKKTLIWQNDFSYEDCGLEGEGIVSILTCSNCGAYVEYNIPLDTNNTERSTTKCLD